ncbi:MAG TPA: site-specific integrase [Terriglobales bacterium]|nr:site-specific integrase [Terriglobales bacterium]
MSREKRRQKGEGSLIKLAGCRFWYASYHDVTGRKIRVSTKTENQTEALNFLRKLTSDRDKGLAPLTDLKKIRYGDLRKALLASYVENGNKSLLSTADGEETIPGLKQLDQHFGFSDENAGPPVTRLGTEAAREFIRARQAEGAGNAIINRSLAALRRMLKLAHREGRIPNVPFIPLLKEPAPRRGFLPLERFERVLNLMPPELKPLICFLYFCGVRCGEALQITWEQVDLVNKLIRLEPEQTKNANARVIPLPGPMAAMLDRIEPKEGLVFCSTNLAREWRTACIRAGEATQTPTPGAPASDPRYGYKGLLLHDLRRSAVRNLRLAGVPEGVVMKITGHKTRSVFERYNIVSSDDLTEAMRRLELASAQNAGFLPGGSKQGQKGGRKALKPA